MKLRSIFLFLYLLIPAGMIAQQSHMFRTVYFPANPYGGEKELTEFIKQEMVYPDEALDSNIEGDVFITYLINDQGKVVYKKVENSGHPLLQQEAMRIFNRILWEADPGRSGQEWGYEKLKISFDKKKYQRLVRQRGYHEHPYDETLKIDEKTSVYTINELDQKPEFTAAESINAFLKDNFRYPEVARQRNIGGRVTAEFIIEPYGKASNIRIVKPVGGGCNEETGRLIRMMKWKPGIKDGKAVRTLYEYHLNFVNQAGVIR
jgi:TonB family protein